jgi:hypothetical protein
VTARVGREEGEEKKFYYNLWLKKLIGYLMLKSWIFWIFNG